MATLNNFTITSAQNQDILIYSNGSWINSNISGFFGILDGRYSANTHNHDGRYMLKADAYTKSQTYPAASLYTRAEIDAMFSGYDGGGGSGGGGGLVNSASNVGSGAGVFHANSSGDLQFRSLFSQDIDLLTIAVSGTSVIFTPKVPTWSRLVSDNGQLNTSHVNFANQGLNTNSSPTFSNLYVSGQVVGGLGNGGPALTTNDGQGNANLTFNHVSGVPDISGNSGRIEFNKDDTSNASFSFEVKSGVTAGQSVALNQVMFLSESTFTYKGQKVYHEGNKPTASDVGLGLVKNISFNWSWGSSAPTHIWGSSGNSQQSYVYTPNDIRDAMNIRWEDIESVPAKIADFSDGVLGNTYTFNNSTYFNSNQVFSRPGISGVVEQSVHTDNYLRFRFGGSSDVKGLSISNYDTVTAYITREGSIKAQEYKNKEDYPLPDQNYRATAAELNTYDTKLTSFNTISDGASIGLTTNWHHVIHLHHNDNNGYAGQIAMTFGSVPDLMFRGANSSGFGAWRKVWTDANDGPGSGLNADMLDGIHESTFARKPGDHTTNNTEYSLVWENNGGTLYTSSAHLKYNPGLRRLTVPSILSDTINLGSSTPVELTRYSNGILGINSPSGFVNIGANNTGYAHLYTDRDQFYFNKGIQVDGYIKVYNKQSQFTADGNHVLVGPTSASFVRVSNNGDIARKNTSWSNNSGEQKILRCDWVGNIGDYLQLQPAGNRSSNGTLSIGTNGFAVGLHDLNGPEADVRIPFTDTWMSVNTTDFWLSGKRVIRHSDNWLRFNEDKSFSEGIYCGDSTLRTDGNLQVGSAGSAFNANTGQIDLKVTTRVYNKLHAREIVSQDGNFTTIGAGELGNSLRDHVIDTLSVGNEGLHLGGESGVYLYAHPNNMTDGMDASYSIRVLASDGASYLNHLDVYKSQNNSNQVMARFRHPIHNGSIALVSKNNDAGSFRFEANMEGQDLRIQTCDTSGNYFTSGISVGTIARFFRDGDVSITREVTAQDFIATSDIRVKENLERIDSSLDKIAKLTGFTYDQVKLKQRKAGLIAQEVKEVLPEAVGEDKDGMLNVSPMAVLALLVNAVNDLAKEVKELKR